MSDAASELEKLRAELAATKAELTRWQAVVSASEAMISALKLEIALLKRDKYGRSAERTAQLIDQLELQLEELEASAAEDALRAELEARKTTKVGSFERRKPVKKPFPEHLPRERVVVDAPTICTCCGSDRIVKMGEDVTETLEVVPRQWKVIYYPAGFCVAKARAGRPCARSSPAGIAKRSASLLHRSTPSPLGGQGPAFWR